jgi:hypothetical protein
VRAISLVVGAPARLSTKLHIAAFVLAPDGSRRVYTKRHLYGSPRRLREPARDDRRHGELGWPSDGIRVSGKSAIWSDSGALVAGLDGLGAGLVVARRSEDGWSGEALLL